MRGVLLLCPHTGRIRTLGPHGTAATGGSRWRGHRRAVGGDWVQVSHVRAREPVGTVKSDSGPLTGGFGLVKVFFNI
jgi:hypothetical protein